MNEQEVKDLCKTLAEGLVKLNQQSETHGDDVALNPARLHMFAFSAYLAQEGILDAMCAQADYAQNSDHYPSFEAKKSEVM